jgi:thioredoxin 1
MSEIITVTDDTLDALLMGDKPVMILVSDGEGIRSDFSSAFKKALGEHQNVIFAKLDPKMNPKAAERFDVGSKPLLIGLYCGETVVRRSRPWGTDVPLAMEQINTKMAELNPTMIEQQPETEDAPVQNNGIVDTKPVTVTDDTFQEEVIDHHLPVVVDFWAEWCGPCRMVAPILDKLAKEFAGQIRIAKVNVDENRGLSSTFQIQSIPTMMLIKNRTIVFSQPGALPEQALRDLIQQLIKLEVPDPEQQQPSEEAQ